MLYPNFMKGTNIPSTSQRKRLWTIAIVVIAAFATLVVIAQLIPQSQIATQRPAPTASAPNSTSAQQYTELPIVQRENGDPMAIGDVDAPVVLVIWTDLRCPFCALFNRETLPILINEYVETGQVRIEVHDVAFFGDQSEQATVAAHAAAEQGKYFEFTQAVYAEAPSNAHPDLPRERLISFAEQADVPDIERFAADLDRPGLIQAAQTSTQNAQSLGVNSVPFFVVGNTTVAGAQPVEVFRSFLDDAIQRAG